MHLFQKFPDSIVLILHTKVKHRNRFFCFAQNERRPLCILPDIDGFRRSGTGTWRRRASQKRGRDRGHPSHPANQRLPQDIKESKMRAAPELERLLRVSEYLRHEEDDGRHPDVTGGWNVYRTRFQIDERMFVGEVKIKNTDRGYLFYDITKIAEVIRTSGQSEKTDAASDNLDSNNVSQSTENVKRKQLDLIQKNNPARNNGRKAGVD